MGDIKNIFDIKCLIKAVVKGNITVESIGDCLLPEPEAPVDPQCVYECFKDNDFKFSPETVKCSMTCIHPKNRDEKLHITPEDIKNIFDIKCLIKAVVKGNITVESIGDCLLPEPED